MVEALASPAKHTHSGLQEHDQHTRSAAQRHALTHLCYFHSSLPYSWLKFVFVDFDQRKMPQWLWLFSTLEEPGLHLAVFIIKTQPTSWFQRFSSLAYWPQRPLWWNWLEFFFYVNQLWLQRKSRAFVVGIHGSHSLFIVIYLSPFVYTFPTISTYF